MRTNLASLISSVCALVALLSIAAQAQSTAMHPDGSRPELALGYNYLHSNAPAGDCGCFSLNGGNVSVAVPLNRAHLSIVGDIGVAHAGSISNTGLDLTLSTYTAGLRYSVPRMHLPLHPFGEVLAGVAHSSGSLVETNAASDGNKGAAFASLVGGGVDLRATHRFSIRLIEADYLVTTFDNGSNDHQNNLRVSTGIAVHF
jgi:outer membrane immunogenic protein